MKTARCRRRRGKLAAAVTLSCLALVASAGEAAHPLAAPGVTSLTNPAVQFTRVEGPVELRRGEVTAVVVDNQAYDEPPVANHRAGYNGVAVLKHPAQDKNLFVPTIAGLNFEHIHDGTLEVSKEKFAPRRAEMELRRIDDSTVEVYQPATPHWKLESCGRYHLLPDGVIEYTFECIPRADTFTQGFIGLFWASYIQAPEDKAIYFKGHRRGTVESAEWLRAVTPRHGVDSTHPPGESSWRPKIVTDFPLTLVNHPSSYVYDEPWYYGISGKMAFVQMFRERDQIWFAQSPTGGGATNPAWDFQWFIPDYQVDEAYGFVMRAAYLPLTDRAAIERATRDHRQALNP